MNSYKGRCTRQLSLIDELSVCSYWRRIGLPTRPTRVDTYVTGVRSAKRRPTYDAQGMVAAMARPARRAQMGAECRPGNLRYRGAAKIPVR